jgi:ABC-type sugar transport system ATPase subunit
MASSAELLTMRGVRKAFAGTTALDDVSLSVRAGEVHAVVGENGAGKSTLMKVLAGLYQPDAGELALDGRVVRFQHPRQAMAAGISLVHQEFSLLPDRTVAENVFLGREPTRRLRVDRRAMVSRTASLLVESGVDTVSPRALVRHLSVAQQQNVEIAKALVHRPRILVLDEPTAALAPHEVDALFTRLRAMVQRGLTVVYISHRLSEVFQLADRVTVLKDGRLVDTVDTSAITPADLVRMMVGRELSNHYFPSRAPNPGDGPVVLQVRDGGNDVVHDIDLVLRGGDIVGLAGLDGSGRSELARALFGVQPFTRGTIEIDGRSRRLTSPRAAIRAGVAFLTADRKAEGLALPLSARDNGLLAARALSGRVAATALRTLSELTAKVGLRPEALSRESRLLSGGNQQKVVLVKWLATQARVYLFDEPTRGVDIGAKARIHDLMRQLAADGAAILMISSELPEIIGMSDRILVMCDGRIAGQLPAGTGEPEIMALASGQAVPA